MPNRMVPGKIWIFGMETSAVTFKGIIGILSLGVSGISEAMYSHIA